MSRKKSITIAPKPSARTSAIVHDTIPTTSSALETSRTEAPAAAAEPCGLFGKALYWPVYCVTYGVVFGALAIGTLIPGKTIIGRAMVDATGSAKRTFSGITRGRKKSRSAAQKAQASTPRRAEIDEPADLVA